MIDASVENPRVDGLGLGLGLVRVNEVVDKFDPSNLGSIELGSTDSWSHRKLHLSTWTRLSDETKCVHFNLICFHAEGGNTIVGETLE